MIPRPILPAAETADASTWMPPGYEPVPPAGRPAIPPPPDDRLEVVRRFILGCCWDTGCANAARVLAKRSPLGDREAWEAVGRGLRPDYRHLDDVCYALGRGDLDGAIDHAALGCGDYEKVGDRRVPLPEKWLREVRDEQARGRS